MAFDGVTVKNIIYELNKEILNTRVYKIAQPEKDELLLTLKGSKTMRLLISVNPSLPLVYLTEDNKQSPETAPTFCMLLRKHISNGRIVAITQPSLERVIDITIEHLDDFGDVCRKHLYIEIMGKYSNIIFVDDNSVILDSIKHIPAHISSVREVLPGRDYFIPNTEEKHDPLTVNDEDFSKLVFTKELPVSKAIQKTFTGLSNILCEEIMFRTGLDPDVPATSFSEDDRHHIRNIFEMFMSDIKNNTFEPTVYYRQGIPFEFSSIKLHLNEDCEHKRFENISELLYSFYNEKNNKQRIEQKGSDLKHLVLSILEKDHKKIQVWEKDLQSCNKCDRYRIYGELINTYGYNVSEGAKSFKALNYYTGEEIEIPLDPQLSTRENSVKYFNRYQKLKRTKEAVEKLMLENEEEIKYLESVDNALNMAANIEDLNAIREELEDMGFAKRKETKKKKKATASAPLHFISSDGFHIYVGKNNLQNEYLSFEFANGNDYWFHSKDFAGSHVILKTEGKELPDRAYEEAAALAAFYSKGANQDKVEIDYTLKKNLKKPPKQKPGFVIYHQNYSMAIKPSNNLKQL